MCNIYNIYDIIYTYYINNIMYIYIYIYLNRICHIRQIIYIYIYIYIICK